jgi:hypothetical protein
MGFMVCAHVNHNSQQPKLHELLEVQIKTFFFVATWNTWPLIILKFIEMNFTNQLLQDVRGVTNISKTQI